MTTMIQNMIDQLAAAKVAMDENPQLKTTITELENMLTETLSKYEALAHDYDKLGEAHAIAIEDICVKEAELEAARFQELATRSQLDKLVSSFSAAISEVVPQADPAPSLSEPELVQQPAPVLASVYISTDTPTVTTAGTFKVEADKQPEVEETDDPRPVQEGTAQAEDYPPTSGPISAPEPESKPFLGKHFSFKPEELSWADWLVGGGKRPWWLTEDELERLSRNVA